jgi:hypothetical protein
MTMINKRIQTGKAFSGNKFFCIKLSVGLYGKPYDVWQGWILMYDK